MSITRRVAYNTAVQIVGRVVGLFIALLTVGYVSNYLVVDGSALKGFGQYTIVFTYISIIGLAADLGVFNLVVREVTGKTKEEAGRLIGSALAFRLLLLITIFVAFFIAIPSFPYAPDVRLGILLGVFIAFSLLFSQVVASLFQANLLTDRIVLVELVGKVLIAVLTITALKLGYGLIVIVAVNLLGNILAFLFGLLLARSLVKIRLSIDWKLWKELLPQFWSIALINVLGVVHLKTDLLLLTLLRSESEVGIYGLSYRILEFILAIPAILAANLLPIFAGLHVADRRVDMIRVVRRAVGLLAVVGIGLVVYTAIFAPWIVLFITQSEFLGAVAPLRTLLVSALFAFISILLVQLVIATRTQSTLVKGYMWAIVLNVILNLIVIPRYSYMGAAIVSVFTELILLLCVLGVTQSTLRGTSWWGLVRPAIAGIVTLAVAGTALHGKDLSVDMFIQLSKVSQGFLLVGSFVATTAVFCGSLWLSLGGSRKKITSLFSLGARDA